VQGTEDRADTAAAPADQPTPSAEGQAAPEPRADLSADARIESNLTQGIRNRLAGSSERPARGAQARPSSDDPDADDEDDEEDDESPTPPGDSATAAPKPSAQPTAQPTAPAPSPSDQPVDRSQLKGRALLRYDLKVANERAEKAERERDEGIAAVRTERDEAVQQAGLAQSRYDEIKPKEAEAILSDNEYARLEYISEHGGLSWDDQQKLDTAKTLREYRQVWIDDADEKVTGGVTRVRETFRSESLKARDRWGVKPEALQGTQTFEAMFDLFGQGGYAKAKAETAERIAQLETDNKALSAQAAGRSAHAPELGGRSAPFETARPGPDASPQEKMAAGIRERVNASGRRNGQRALTR
jgi:hypothetical protein